MPKKTPNNELARRVKALRGKGTSQEEFAGMLGVKQSAVSSWEQGFPEPSAENYIRLGNHASSYDDRKWFWKKAGVDMQAVDNFIDMRAQKSGASRFTESIEVPALDQTVNETVVFQSALLANPASTRFVRIKHSEPPFCHGDIVFIDTRATDLRELAEGDAIAIGDSSAHFGMSIGTLSKRQVAEDTIHFIIEQGPGRGQLFAWVTGKGAPEVTRQVIGKVVGWVHATGEHAKHRRLDMEASTAFHKVRNEGKQK